MRRRPLIVYVTSTRSGCESQISDDVVWEIQRQLQLLPKGTTALDLLLVSIGADPAVAWRIVSLIRERCTHLAVLVPDVAYSAATLIALGADAVIMHPNGMLGPTDPQIRLRSAATSREMRFGSEDLAAYLEFVRDNVSAKDEHILADAFGRFCEDAGSAVAVGVAARASRFSVSLGERLLRFHMKGEHARSARCIARKLARGFLHHGYSVSRSEARRLGLKVVQPHARLEALMEEIWTSLTEELRLREPFNAIQLLKANPACAPLFAPVPTANIPMSLPPDLMQDVVNQVLAGCAVHGVPPTPFRTVDAIVESPRHVSHFVTHGLLLASRMPDFNLRVTNVLEKQGWETLHSIATLSSPMDISITSVRNSECRGTDHEHDTGNSPQARS